LRVEFINFVNQKAGGVFDSVISIAVMGLMLPPLIAGRLDYGMFIVLAGGILSLTSTLFDVEGVRAVCAMSGQICRKLFVLHGGASITELILVATIPRSS
jgi:hypothetical protein